MDNQNQTVSLNLPEIDQYVEELLKTADLKLVVPEREDYKQKLAVEAERRLGIVAMDLLNDDSLDEFTALLDEQGEQIDADTIRNFFQAKIPNFDEQMKQAMRNFSKEFLRTAGEYQPL